MDSTIDKSTNIDTDDTYNAPENKENQYVFPPALEGLAERKQWAVGMARLDDKGKLQKWPINPADGRRLNWSNVNYRMTLEQALRAGWDVLFFILTEADPYAMIDLDGVRDPETGNIDPRALEIVREYDSYTEVSPSGKGLSSVVEGVA